MEPTELNFPENLARRGGRQPTLLGALASFLSGIALIVFLFFVVGQWDLLGLLTRPEPAMKGTYVMTAPRGDGTREAHFATAEYAVRFLDGDRVELRMNGGFRDGYYRVERDNVLIETAEPRGENLSLAFKIEGERLIGSGLVLLRQNH